MDPVTLLYYAAVCGLLGMAGPFLGGHAGRFVAGVLVGLAAAAALPPLRGALGL
ncbi:hypothetical protein [Amaricoccus sp.]|uniref:hypothetical protein n=1 Tax=Amaricoccus sp. TaxID=1872485 RepID=UPI001B6F9D7F|nr:hypothetical protein [Amaricoccus sp.]MBP7240441.1 hypothetical protein [Amaricoccus sp.]